MAQVPTAERPPRGLDAYWLGVWRHALKVMREQGTWRWEQRPLLDEYVEALMGAKRAREADQSMQWNRHTNRAAALAEILVLTPKAQRAAGVWSASTARARDPVAEAIDDLERLGQRARLHAV